MVLKRPLRGKKFEILVKLRKSEFLCQNRVCRGRISGIGHRKYKNWLKITIFMTFLKCHKNLNFQSILEFLISIPTNSATADTILT